MPGEKEPNIRPKTTLLSQVLVEESVLQRMKLEALITELVHQRTVIRHLLRVCADNIITVDSFVWLYYMRFYWDEGGKVIEDKVVLKQADASFCYGFEYQGVVERLVQTPLSDRAYLTLTQAMHARLGGSPYGPAGTGKTETVKALGCQLGRYVLVFCCDENFDMHAMGRIFIGLCQVGAWGCFDEFNRLEERMLSAVSQQIQTIQEGLLSDADTIDLLGRSLKPSKNMGIFVTMNPGYAGRSELPDNLKQLLRACAMTAPDRELIAEVMLYAQGFTNAERLSQKVVPLFNLCRDQLSAQPHYDFALRALKAVLRSAGSIKRSLLMGCEDDESRDKLQTLEIEQELVIRSIAETVSPKLVGSDIVLLGSLISDVFPGVKQEERPFTELKECIRAVCKKRNLVCTDIFMLKIIQLFQIQSLHHGFMVVGPTGTGKSAAWSVLLDATGMLKGIEAGKSAEEALDQCQRYVVSFVVDPKSMTKDELYGELDNTTREWKDGVFTRLLRKFIDETKSLPPGAIQREGWFVFDGDVDPVWVENLNSVLDDNKLLTLPNGERLALLPNIRVVFEVENLKYATPATVSRCGMVWFSDNTIENDMVVQRYLLELKTEMINFGDGMDDAGEQMKCQAKCADIYGKYILGDASLLTMAIEEAQKHFTIMDWVTLQALNSYFTLLNVGVQQVVDYNGSHPDYPLDDAATEKFLSRHLLRSLVWACGGSMKLADRLEFGRTLITFTSIEVTGFHDDVSLVELACDVNNGGEWTLWRSMLPEQSVTAKQVGGSSVVITTEDTVRHVDTLGAWLRQRKPLILCGPPGSGKTMTLMSTLRENPNMDCGPSSPSRLLRFPPISQYLLEPASVVWALQFGC